MGGEAQVGGPPARRWCVPLAALALASTLSAPVSAAPGARPGHAAPDFALRAFHGPNVRLSEHVGEVVVVSFWGSGCDSCRAQLEALQRDFSREHALGLRVFGVEVAGDQDAALRFAGRIHVTFPLLLDPTNTVSRLYRIESVPETFLIDRNGNIRYVVREFNETSHKLCEHELSTLLAE